MDLSIHKYVRPIVFEPDSNDVESKNKTIMKRESKKNHMTKQNIKCIKMEYNREKKTELTEFNNNWTEQQESELN